MDAVPWYDRVWYTVAVFSPGPINTGLHAEFTIHCQIAPRQHLSLALFGYSTDGFRTLGGVPKSAYVAGPSSTSFSPSPVDPAVCMQPPRMISLGVNADADETGKLEVSVRLRGDELFAIEQIRIFSPDEDEAPRESTIQIIAGDLPLFIGDSVQLWYLQDHREYVEHSRRHEMERVLAAALLDYGDYDENAGDEDGWNAPRSFFRRVAAEENS